MSSENNNVYRMGNKNMTNIHKKLHNACNHASGVRKAAGAVYTVIAVLAAVDPPVAVFSLNVFAISLC